MAISVNPTRMELTRLKKSLATARRGHRLLKDKRDELMRRFLEMVREAKVLREFCEEKLLEAGKSLSAARSGLGREIVGSALLMPHQEIGIEIGAENVMSVDIPTYKPILRSLGKSAVSYGFAFTNASLDDAVLKLADLTDSLLKLAELEKAASLLAGEIERTRRRVNALEYIMIPDHEETIRYIIMKLDEQERANTTRLMKVKDMVLSERGMYKK